VKDIHKVINNFSKSKPHINITTKDHLQKQIIVPIDNDNILTFMKSSGDYIANITQALKGVKSDNFFNFTHSNH